MLSVSDTGAGMSKDVLARAFEPFLLRKNWGTARGLA
jgi:C4-dicarboxylate-specific signal transduction histidine kinase